MSKQVLIVDPSSILNSQPIQIIHKHPDFSHRVRSDLDPYEVIAFSYPTTLANKIIPFLETSPICTAATTRTGSRTRSLKRQRTASPPKRRKTSTDSDSERQNETKSVSPRRELLRKISPSRKDMTTATSTTQALTSLPTPYLTPIRQLDPPIQFTPGTIDTAYTSRTISPDGTTFSPLKPLTDTWPPTLPTSSQASIISTSSIPPSALFTPTKAARTRRATATPESSPPPTTTTTMTHKSNRPRNPPRLIHFNPTPTSLDREHPLPTLCLRHDLPTDSLRDVLEWCLVSVQAGRIVDLEGWMIRFRDTARVRGILEVCRGLGLKKMGVAAERLLERLERGFGAKWDVEWLDE